MFGRKKREIEHLEKVIETLKDERYTRSILCSGCKHLITTLMSSNRLFEVAICGFDRKCENYESKKVADNGCDRNQTRDNERCIVLNKLDSSF